jgi:hypothetical protein
MLDMMHVSIVGKQRVTHYALPERGDLEIVRPHSHGFFWTS